MAHYAKFLILVAIFLIPGACTTVDIAKLADVEESQDTTDERVTIAAGFTSIAKPKFGDRDPHEWNGRNPHHYTIHGVDVSKYQGGVAWHKLRANGVSFVFIKATEGGDRFDDHFTQHWRGAKSAGIPRGAYHFFYFCRPAIEQARWFIRHVPKESSSLPPVLDMEWNPHSPSCKLRPDADIVRKEMGVFLSSVERHYGKKPIIYTTIDFYRDNELHRLKGYPFWLRSVAGDPSAKFNRQPWLFWQYTGTGIVPGIDGDADINVFNGDAKAWREWLASN